MISSASPQLQAAYALGRSAALTVRLPEPGVLMVRGATRLDLLQRMSTNDLTDIAEGEIRPTILTTAIGRIVDRVLVLSLGDRWMVMTSPGRGDTVLSWLRRHVFFQDDVSLEPVTAFSHHWFILGPRAGDDVRSLLETDAPPAPGRGLAFPAGLLWATLPPEPAGVHLLLELTSSAPVLASGIGAVEATVAEEAYQALRIEAGFPEFGREFNDDDIPLEVGLTYAVSFSKGCYLGQEIIARMESRARTPRQLVGARLPRDIPVPFDFPHGRLTSAAVLATPGMDRPCRRPPGSVQRADPVDGTPIELLELPFPRD